MPGLPFRLRGLVARFRFGPRLAVLVGQAGLEADRFGPFRRVQGVFVGCLELPRFQEVESIGRTAHE